MSTSFEKVKLRPLKAENAFKIFELVNHNRKQFIEWMPWVKGTTKVSDTTQFVKDSLRKMRDRTAFVAEIWYFNDLVGLIDLQNINTIDRKASIGYWLCQTAQKKGIMTYAVKHIIEYGFTEYQLNRISILIAETNAKSIKIPQRLHMKQEGILRAFSTISGKSQNMVVFSVLRNEWGNNNSNR